MVIQRSVNVNDITNLEGCLHIAALQKIMEKNKMRISRQNIVLRVLFIACCFVANGRRVCAITLQELQQISKESQEQLSTARIVYIKEVTDNSPIQVEPNTLSYNIEKLNKHTRSKVTAVMDNRTQQLKHTENDLRDVDKLLEENGLPPKQKCNVSRSKVVVTSKSIEMHFTDGSLLDGQAELNVYHRPGVPDNFRMRNLGILDDWIFAESWDAKLEEKNDDGRTVLVLELSKTNRNGFAATVECDPALAYRFRSIQLRYKNRLIREYIADDYRIVNGLPYPFFFVKRAFAMDGSIIKERKYSIEHAELGLDLTADDFGVPVPDDTRIVNAVLDIVDIIEQDQTVGIEDVLGNQAKMLAYEELARLDIRSNPHGFSQIEILIPNFHNAIKQSKPFILDLAKAVLIYAPVADKLDTENVYNYLTKLGKGDIAWDGSLVTLRDSKVFMVKQEAERPFKHKTGRWTASTELLEGIELPYNLLIANKEGVTHLITIEKITLEGISVICKKLNANEAEQYLLIEQ